eukprot:10580791-Lingulodinium_polyedra.AAC.1
MPARVGHLFGPNIHHQLRAQPPAAGICPMALAAHAQVVLAHQLVEFPGLLLGLQMVVALRVPPGLRD